MRSRVIAHSGLVNPGVHHRIHLGPHTESKVKNPTLPKRRGRVGHPGDPRGMGAPSFRALCGGRGFHDDLMCSHPLHRVVAPLNLSNDSIELVTVKTTPISNLPARLR